MKFDFYFVLKAFFLLKISKFCPDFCDHVGKRFMRKLMLISKIVTSQTGQQRITIQILLNIFLYEYCKYKQIEQKVTISETSGYKQQESAKK